jgi:FixJ family two-component response regulator
MEARTFLSVEEFLKTEVSDLNACLICDVAMPGIGGLELPGLLAAAGRHLPVIFVTAHDTAENRALAQQVGASAFFRKPVDDQALLDAIDWVLNPKLNRPAKA